MRLSTVRPGSNKDVSRPPGGLQRQGVCQENCAACCQYIVLQVNPQYAEEKDVKHWIELHGINLVKRGGALWAYIPTPCSALDGTRCSLYDTKDRPKVCDVWPTSQADIDDLEDHTGQKCTYYFPGKGGEK
jgi:Fe-S-cluster containining protein